MKRLWIIAILTTITIAGCANSSNLELKTDEPIKTEVNNDDTESGVNNIPMLTEEEALKIGSEASYKFHSVTLGGYGIPDCTFENTELIEIDGKDYYYFGNCLDTFEELNTYLENVFTDNAIEAIIDTLGIIEYNGKLLKVNADAGGSLEWQDAKISLLEMDGEIAEVEINVPSVYEQTISIQISYLYTNNKGWLINTDKPFDLY